MSVSDVTFIFFAISVSITGETVRRNIFNNDIRSEAVNDVDRIAIKRSELEDEVAISLLKLEMSLAYLDWQTARISGNRIDASIGVMILCGFAMFARYLYVISCLFQVKVITTILHKQQRVLKNDYEIWPNDS